MIRIFDDAGKEWHARISYEIGQRTWVDICTRNHAGEWQIEYIGKAVCHEHDRWDRKRGRKIAFTRAIATLPREVRKRFWEAFWLDVKL